MCNEFYFQQISIKNLTLSLKKIYYSHITIKGYLILFSVPLRTRYSCCITEQDVKKKLNNPILQKELATHSLQMLASVLLIR